MTLLIGPDVLIQINPPALSSHRYECDHDVRFRVLLRISDDSFESAGISSNDDFNSYAYNSTTRGYNNSSGQKGCIDSGTYN